jgi:lysyl-tRNA synthetase class 2
MLAHARRFFSERGVMEVDCMMLTDAPSIDAYINLIPATCQGGTTKWLHSSPEYAMKRLLSAGCPDIFQLGHVFRDGESGSRHNPEFTMAEWYRLGMSFQEMMHETCAFIQLFLGELPIEFLSYQEAFQRYLNIDPLNATEAELFSLAKDHAYSSLETEGRDAILNLLIVTFIEPHLGNNCLTVLYHFPASQAALSKVVGVVAERFEVYYHGQELANGYHELADSAEQRVRFAKANQMRQEPLLPFDEPFLEALDRLPDCCGVAVGFDRLMMIRNSITEIKQILPIF